MLRPTRFAAAAVACLAALSLVSCSSTSAPSTSASAPAAATKEVSLTDQAGRQVKVKMPVERMVVLQHHSLDTIAMIGGQKNVVGVVEKWPSLLGDYMKDVFPGIEKLPTPGGLDDANVEEVAKLKPGVVIVAPQFSKDKIAQMEKLGMSVVVIAFRGEGAQAQAQNPDLKDADKAYTDGTKWAIETLGQMTGTEKKAEKLWGTASANRQYVADKLKGVPENQRVRAFLANPDNTTSGTDKYVSVQLVRAGAINVAVPEIKGNKPYTLEQVSKWNPDAILVQERYKADYDTIMNDAKWQALPAVKNKKVYITPTWTKTWGNPGPDSIALGELWLANLFYPDKIEKSYVEKQVNDFYTTFYGVPFKGKV